MYTKGMKKTLIFVFILVAIFGVGGYIFSSGVLNPDEKLYVAVEKEGKIAVIDAAKNKVIKNIDLAKDHEGDQIIYYPHNVQVAPDGKTVWVTANAGQHQHAATIVPEAHAHGEVEGAEPDEIIVIDPKNDRVTQRIDTVAGAQLAHVAVSPDGLYVYVTAQKEEAIYKVNAKTFQVEKKIFTKKGAEPHGLRLNSDASLAYIAFMGDKSLMTLNLANASMTETPLEGTPIQTGVTPNRKFVFASLYDTKELAVWRADIKVLGKVKLPDGAKGPLQMYPTPDSKFVYLADQGYYFGVEPGHAVYKIELETGKVLKEIQAGSAPHGVVVSHDGTKVYVTNVLSGDVSVINTASDSEVSRIKVGKEPNGVSLWSKTLGGTP